MSILRDKCNNFIDGKKRRYLILPIYFFYIVIFVLVLGVFTDNLWDKLIKCSRNKSK